MKRNGRYIQHYNEDSVAWIGCAIAIVIVIVASAFLFSGKL